MANSPFSHKYLLTILFLLISLKGATAQDELNNQLEQDSIEWVTIRVIDWEMIPKPSLALGNAFIFDVNTAQLPDDFDMMKLEVSCRQIINAKVLGAERLQDVSSLCEFGMDEAVTGIHHEEATAFCHQIKGELPSESQWVYVASKIGSAWLTEHGMFDRILHEATLTMESFKEDVTDAQEGPYGIQGLYGNVWEMTRSKWANQTAQFVIKGGAFDLSNKPWLMHPYLRAAFIATDIHNQNIGFRCVR